MSDHESSSPAHISRRRFVQASGAAAVVGLAGAAGAQTSADTTADVSPPHNRPQPTAVDVCVIGAGFAGLAAAHAVRAAGKTVIVLEARDRVGGRSL
jgi:monoamine oxidase